MSESILLVDDDPNVLQAYRRQFHGRFQLRCEGDAKNALTLLDQSEVFAVVVSDMHMPGMDGVQFLSEVRRKSPDSVRMMLTGNATLQTSIDAVNDGHIFRFLIKPCPADVFGKALEAGLAQHRLITAEKQLLSKTLGGAIKLTSEILSLTNPTAFGCSSRVQRLVSQLVTALRVPQGWQCVIAAMLSQIGCIAVPEEILDKVFKNFPLSDEEASTFWSHPAIGRDLIANIPRLEPVAEIIAFQNARFDEGMSGSDLRGEQIPLGARILKVALDFDILLAVHESPEAALSVILARSAWYDPAVIMALHKIIDVEPRQAIISVPISELPSNAVLAKDVRSVAGRLLVARGQEINQTLRALLLLRASSMDVPDHVEIYAPMNGVLLSSK